jgi:hypothetical protein
MSETMVACPPGPHTHSLDEVCALIGCESEDWPVDRVRSGQFPARRIAGNRRFTDSDIEAIIGACVAVPRLSDKLGDLLDPHGFFVYLLLGEGSEPLYVGQSRNIFTRLGTHMGPRNHRDLVKKVRLIRCADDASMRRIETSLIHELGPRLNVHHRAVAS